MLIFIITEILEVNFFPFAYRLFHEDFSPIYEVLFTQPFSSLYTLIWNKSELYIYNHQIMVSLISKLDVHVLVR